MIYKCNGCGNKFYIEYLSNSCKLNKSPCCGTENIKESKESKRDCIVFEMRWHCSECKETFYSYSLNEVSRTNFCINCGSDEIIEDW